ncbi:uncharacterized protein MAM_05782 [Metarhizium album ARSEF 1941]|uniref:Uncharacterized protein n=1 Tax=Metarhizium album (strain ARSEF 1941) TaxID=1081103 RepID=A0A0B2WR51_METAS|nr:uncharacterized protein MAM_05782 [Metarhizium album ARSEF 1941]KHN96493.1 hypothetical protein MAM_05782 [Metarhizium album ARSEF 1941]
MSSSSSYHSKVGNSAIYEDGDQRNLTASEKKAAERFKEGQPGSHSLKDPKDQRTISNRVAAEEKGKKGDSDDLETAMYKKDPTLPVSLANYELAGATTNQSITG